MTLNIRLSGLGRFPVIAATLLLSLSVGSLSVGAAEKAEYLWRMNVIAGPTDIKTRFHQEFANLVEERTNGKIQFKLFPASSLVPAGQAATQVSSGVLKIDANGPNYYESVVPMFRLLALPFYGLDMSDLREVMKPGTRGAEIMDEALAKANLKLLTMFEAGNLGFAAFEPLDTVASFRGKKLRISGGPTADCLRAIGAEVVTMGGAEAVDSMSRRVVDASTIEPTGILSRGYNDFATHWSNWSPQANGALIMMNLDEWNSLPSNLRDIVWQTAQEVGERANAAVGAEQAKALEKVVSGGMTAVEVENSEREAIRAQCRDIIEAAVAGIEPQDRAREFVQLLNKAVAGR